MIGVMRCRKILLVSVLFSLPSVVHAAADTPVFPGTEWAKIEKPDTERDQALFARLGLRPMAVTVDAAEHDGQADQDGGTVHAAITAQPAHAA